MVSNFRGKKTSLEHKDPKNHSLVCGLTNELNECFVEHSYNSRKQNRFVPYRVCNYPAPNVFGDVGEFLVKGEWTVCEFGSETWWKEANDIGCGSTVSKKGSGCGVYSGHPSILARDEDYYKRLSKTATTVTSKKVVVTSLDTKEEFFFDSLSQACRVLNLNPGHLSSVCLGKRPHHKGFVASFVKDLTNGSET